MSDGPRLLGVVSRSVIAIWIGAYLAWIAADRRLEPPDLDALARIQPLLEEALRETPPPARDESREPLQVARSDLAQGAELLDASGSFPALSFSYEDFVSFRGYARAMEALGARFVVVRHREILGSIDLETGGIDEGVPGAAFSPRARDYTGEAGLGKLSRVARKRFGGDAVVMMLVPRAIDAGLFGSIARVLSERGDRHNAYREIRGRYQRAPGGGVRLRIDSGVRIDGSEVGLDLLFDLTDIARMGDVASDGSA